ncbi:unnamed protein product [Mytilus edulis]|uniref:Uncharacterized protein n=1 Tax=Mytilus edulis TaxID=6550 RepID=A0A8S3S001_MYTED|nr:unnamed protein product [Mytilus edulis]
MRARSCLVQVENQCHDEAKPAAMKRDEKHVQDLIVYITENITNLFDVDNHPRQLINISTGLLASHDIEDLLLKSVETGRIKMKIFVESSLSTDNVEHVLRSCLQTKMWMSSHLDHPNHLSLYEYGWKKSSQGPDPVYFLGMMTSDFLPDLIFSCKGKYICSTSCICREQQMSSTELCHCQGSDTCQNIYCKEDIDLEDQMNDDDEDENDTSD